MALSKQKLALIIEHFYKPQPLSVMSFQILKFVYEHQDKYVHQTKISDIADHTISAPIADIADYLGETGDDIWRYCRYRTGDILSLSLSDGNESIPIITEKHCKNNIFSITLNPLIYEALK